MKANKSISYKIIFSILMYIVVLFVIVISLVPLLWVFISTFKTNNEILSSAFSWPASFSLRSYLEGVRTVKIGQFYFNSFFVSIMATAISIFMYSMSGYVLGRFKFRGKSVVYAVIAFAYLIPLQSMLQPVFIIVRGMGLYNTKAALILVYCAVSLPFANIVMKSGFSSLPHELEESAYVEGANFFRTFVQIILPISKPFLASVGVMLFLSNWNEFLFALMLTNSIASRTLPVALQSFVGGFSYDYPALFAVVILSIIPSIVIYILMQEQIVSSLTAGAVKG